MRILIVDDSQSIRTVIKSYVLKALPSAKIFEASDGIIAEIILQESHITDEPIEVIFLDWMMPRLSGKEFLSNIRAIEQFKIAPEIIMLTAETYPEQINSVVKFNVSSYVTKPFSAEDIAKAIDKIIEKNKLKQVS